MGPSPPIPLVPKFPFKTLNGILRGDAWWEADPPHCAHPPRGSPPRLSQGGQEVKSHHRTQFHGAGLLGWGRGGCWAPNPTYKSKASSKSGCSSFLLHWVVRATTSGNSCRGSKVSWTKGSLEPGGVQTSAPSCWGSWGGVQGIIQSSQPSPWSWEAAGASPRGPCTKEPLGGSK